MDETVDLQLLAQMVAESQGQTPVPDKQPLIINTDSNSTGQQVENWFPILISPGGQPAGSDAEKYRKMTKTFFALIVICVLILLATSIFRKPA